jgi:hypothetical protein
MRKIWLRFSDPWRKNVISLGVFTWNVPLYFRDLKVSSYQYYNDPGFLGIKASEIRWFKGSRNQGLGLLGINVSGLTVS